MRRPGLLDELRAYAAIEPFGPPAWDERLRYALASLSNTIGGGKRTSSDPKAKPSAWQQSDFPIRLLPSSPRRRAETIVCRMSVEESVRQVESAFSTVGLRFTESWQPPE